MMRKVAPVPGDGQGHRDRLVTVVAGGHIAHGGRGSRRTVAAGAVMAGVAANDGATEETVPVHGAVGLDHREHRAAVVGAVAGLALRAIAFRAFWCALTQVEPTGCIPCGPPVDRARHRGMAGGAFRPACRRGPAVPCSEMLSLGCEVGKSAWVEPWQASHCRPPWPDGEPVKRQPGRRRVGSGCEGLVHRRAHVCRWRR